MKIENFTEEKITSFNFEVKKINDTYSAFRCTVINQYANVNDTTVKEGIQLNKNITNSIEKGTLLSPLMACFSSKELLDFHREYGYYMSFSDYENNEFSLKDKFNKMYDDNTITFDLINENNIDSILIFCNSSYEIKNLTTNKIYASAFNLDNLLINESQYKSFKDIVNTFIQSGRIKRYNKKELFDKNWGYSLHYANASICFSEEEFDIILKEYGTIENDYISSFKVSKIIEKLDLLNINQYLKSEEEKEEDYKRYNPDF